MVRVNNDFWKNKRVFITGHTGFKGSWISLWLQQMDVILKGYSLPPSTYPNLFEEAHVSKNMESEINDIRDVESISKSIIDFNPDVLIHMAAQPLVRESYSDPLNTYSTNVMGTLNVLEAARKCKNLKAIVAITTDKCYENDNRLIGYKENDPIGGYDPYSSSKGCCELLISSYRRSFFNKKNNAFLASARAGNVIGGGDWSNDRLIPDIFKAFENSEPVIIRNSFSVRPWQHVLEPLSGYLVLAQELYINGDEFAEGWNFGPKDEDCKSVSWVLDEIVKNWGGNANWSLDKNSNPHEAGFLKLDCSKAYNYLNWIPKWSLKETIKLTVDWHKLYLRGGDLHKQCLKEINNYIK